MPNSYNRLQGSGYTNSSTTGKWADYIAEDLVEYIDNKYRTLPQRESRAVIGHSMGGYGGMNLGMNYPDVFNCMGSMAGLLDLTQYPVRISWAYAQAAKLKNLSDFYSQPYDVRAAITMSAGFCPNPDRLPFYADFPWERDASNKLVKNEEVWDRFMEHDILTRLEENASALLNMGAIYTDCGTSDGFNFLVDLRRIRDELQRLGVPHHYREFSGDHTCCVMTSTGEALEVFSNAMAFEMLVGVEPAGKLATAWAMIRAY
jgi:S-formylglutathione hydrolase FrmB